MPPMTEDHSGKQMVQASRYYIADARDVGVAKFMLEPKLINNEIEKEGRKEEKKKKEEKKMRSGSFSCQLLDSRC
jgi:hypothetical protein